MRSFIAAAILSFPALVSAQAMHSVSHLLASVDAPAYMFQAGALNAGMPRVFSGLIAPIRLTSADALAAATPIHQGEMVVSYIVDTNGVPEDVQVVKSADAMANARVVEAVRNMRYTPGKLDGQPVATPVTLHIAFTR